MKEIILHNKNLVAFVDDWNYEWINQYRWRAIIHRFGHVYAGRSHKFPGSDRYVDLKMHQLITGFSITDHINGNGLDNQIHNLREATRAQNRANSKTNRLTNLPKGVYPTASGKWQAMIRVSTIGHYLGVFSTKEEASQAYLKAAIEHFGEFANAG